MNGREFYDRIAKHKVLDWRGIKEAVPRKYHPEAEVFTSALPDRVYIGDAGHENVHEIPVSEILTKPWNELEQVLTGAREAVIMRHVTRVVGYYSRVANWNRSKVAELGDRGRGNYSVPMKTGDMNSDLPQEVQDILAEDMVCSIDKASK